jgi:hypothetical protein
MTTKTVFQTDRAGLYVGDTIADESPLEPGVFLIPAGAVEKAPPKKWADGKWPRWNGTKWELVTKPQAVAANDNDPVAKLRDFLAANPDVAAILEQGSV